MGPSETDSGSSPGGDEPPSSRSGRAIPPNLLVVAERISLRMAEASAEEIRVRYDLGRLVHRLRSESSERSLAPALTKLGREFNMKPGTLRRYARVAEAILPEEFDGYMTRFGLHGMQLTWSHLEELAEIRRPDVRRMCGEQAITEWLGVSDLRARARALTRP